MNEIWSRYVQGIRTLYDSRKLRFDDRFAGQYRSLFRLEGREQLRILEIGCGPGALASALRRWYPEAEITAVDRDSRFIRYAREREQGITFVEGDATALPFEDASFDAVISNTVSEHIEPSAFYAQQLRVLKPGGVCLVLSSRRGIHTDAACILPSGYEKRFWEKVNRFDDSMERYCVCRYPMTESELPAAMEKYGFREVQTGYALIDLTPDDPKYPAEMAHAMIDARRHTALEAIESAGRTMPEHVEAQEIEEMKRIVNAKYDERIRQYDRGEKQWETSVSVIMVVRGVK